MKKIERPVWVTDDGQEFETESDAAIHERTLAIGPQVQEYLNTLETPEHALGDRKRAEYTRILEGYEQWQAQVLVASQSPAQVQAVK